MSEIPTPAQLVEQWREQAITGELAHTKCCYSIARSLHTCADQLEASLRLQGEHELALSVLAFLDGLAGDHEFSFSEAERLLDMRNKAHALAHQDRIGQE